MPLLAVILALLALSSAPALAPAAAEERETLTVTTSLGPLQEETDTRELRARGKAPKGSKLEVRYYRGKKRLGVTRPKMGKNRRYKSDLVIDRTGVYRVKVIAITRSKERIVVSAKLRYTPDAQAPSAPEDPQD
ncbi:MAG: hypothetical protein M3P50_01255 [Actinomycetota bacterium]|nr:hypothetical protein [Actinomycetota bacterium]